MRKFQQGTFSNIVRDDLIELTGPAAKDYPVGLRSHPKGPLVE